MPFVRHHPLADPVYVRSDSPAISGRAWLTGTLITILIGLGVIIFLLLFGPEVFAQTRLPGTDASDKLQMAGTLLQLIDRGVFSWAARVFSGLCIFSSAWALKEQRFGIAVICIIGAVMFGTAPTWVKNVFAIGGSDSVFGYVLPEESYA